MRDSLFIRNSGLNYCRYWCTTSDVGYIKAGFPRQSAIATDVGVRTNFRMPDIISIGLGEGH